MGKKVRADKYLVDNDYFTTREKAQAAIQSGLVTVNGMPVTKSGSFIDEKSNVSIIEHKQYVSRGALKLNKAIDTFGVNVVGKIAVDVGASTGGFTQSLLEKGAKQVAAVDVGYGQLDWKIRSDPRVDVFERKNIRYFTREELGYFADLAVIDVSFISILKVLEAVKNLFQHEIEIIALIKPQFEAPKGAAKNGIVRQPEAHRQVLSKLVDKVTEQGFCVNAITYSPVTGAKGNIEFFFLITSPTDICNDVKSIINKVVEDAHGELIS